MDRRQFLQSTLVGAVASALPFHRLRRRPRVLLHTAWQTINIGDIAHTPGAIHLINTYHPEVEVTLWPSDVGDGVKEMLTRRFPNLQIVQQEDEVQSAIQESDFLLHGSGPFLVGAEEIKRWREETDKPYGVFGISVPGHSTYTDTVRKLLTQAEFVFFRDSVSLHFAQEHGVECPIMMFGPDATFSADVRDDESALSFMADHGLQHGKFMCCIPRYRHFPYWKFSDAPVDEEKQARNEEMKEHDHAPLREAISSVVRETDMKVLVCPEDISQMALGKEMIVDKLPEDVRQGVVWKEDFWLTDQALSTYLRSAGLFGLEQHSPIMCIGNGIPAIVGRFDEQTSKTFMWRDIGLHDWLFDMDYPEQVEDYAPTVLSMAKNPIAAKSKAEKAHGRVEVFQKRMVETLENTL
jgi:polysaccharide pyruvyl transferase WcaK-like protein